MEYGYLNNGTIKNWLNNECFLCQIVSYLPTFQTYFTKINTFGPFSLPNTHHQKFSIFDNKEIRKSTGQKKFQKKNLFHFPFSFPSFLFFFFFFSSFLILILFLLLLFFVIFSLLLFLLFLLLWFFSPFFFFFFGKQKTMMTMNYKLVVIVWS